jgi:hypothetical protein
MVTQDVAPQIGLAMVPDLVDVIYARQDPENVVLTLAI